MDREVAKKVLSIALATGADYAELYVQNRAEKTIDINYKRVDNVLSGLVYGAGLRLMRGVSQVYGYSSDISESSLTALARKLSASFDGKRKLSVGEFEEFFGNGEPKLLHSAISTADKIDYLRKGEAAMYGKSPLVVNAQCISDEIDETVEIFTVSEKVCRAVTDRRVRTRIIAMATAGKNGAFETGRSFNGLSKGAELYGETDFVKLADSAADLAVRLLDAPECPSGNMPAILGNGFGGVLFHEACGHPLEGTAISHNTSPFAGKLGQKVASELVTAVDSGIIENGWGSLKFDDEGERTTENVLIKDGVLVSYMMDNFDGRRISRPSTGACRRESYKYLPTTRMTNTYIAAGKSDPSDIIKATDFGLYCVSFNGGSVNPATDKFNFTSSETYVVKNGKIDHLVKSPCLVGFGYDILKKIDMVGNDLKLASGLCGAASGSIEAAVGQPTLRVSEIAVGGKGEAI